MGNNLDKKGLRGDIETRKETLSGSESIARAVAAAGAAVAASYPGGPVTKIVEKLIDLSKSCDLYVEWSNCEKVAFEVALGCSLAGRRSVIAAKHVGINHILDPLMTVNLTGSSGGMVIIHEFILDDTMDSPLFPALFSLNMLLGTPSGQAYSKSQLRAMLEDAGAKQIRRIRFDSPNDSGILMGLV